MIFFSEWKWTIFIPEVGQYPPHQLQSIVGEEVESFGTEL